MSASRRYGDGDAAARHAALPDVHVEMARRPLGVGRIDVELDVAVRLPGQEHETGRVDGSVPYRRLAVKRDVRVEVLADLVVELVGIDLDLHQVAIDAIGA